MHFVCPACKGPLAGEYECAKCALSFPVIHGIPDFRLHPDPYIGIQEDRIKASHLYEVARTRSFRQMLDYYYSITEEDPGDLAILWTAHALAEAEIGKFLLRESGVKSGEAVLDIGCSTGGLLVAAHPSSKVLAGIDVALRWLIIAAVRLREAGVEGRLVCANAEALPFPSESFDTLVCADTVEHLRDAPAGMREAYRVSTPGATLVCATNNRYAPLPDPQVHLWGVGWLPRAWQADYVAWRRKDLHRYQIQMRSAGEMDRLVRDAGFATSGTEPAPLNAPHRPKLAATLRVYNRFRRVPFLRTVSPRLWTIGRKLRV